MIQVDSKTVISFVLAGSSIHPLQLITEINYVYLNFDYLRLKEK